MSMSDLGLPVHGDVACKIVRRLDLPDPAEKMPLIKASSQVEMLKLLQSVDEDLARGWDEMCAGRTVRRPAATVTSAASQPRDLKSLMGELAKTGRLPELELDLGHLSETTTAALKTLSEPRLKRALELPAWAVHYGRNHLGGVCCDLDDAKGSVCLGGVLPATRG